MNVGRILALVYRDLLIIRRSKWRLVEIFYFPLTTMLMWGFYASYSASFAFEAGLLVLVISLFWNFAYVAQSTVNMQMMEDVWFGSLKQLFLSGVSEVEYVAARIFTATVVSAPVLALMAAVAFFSGWDFLSELPLVAAISALTLLTSLAMAVLITGMIVVLGRGYGFLSWTALQAFVLLSAPFFPREVFPGFLQPVSAVMPYTYIFEAARNLALGSPVGLWKPTLVAAAYFVFVWPVYIFCFRLARKNGNLVKLA
ncbi:TPA: ABC transporter permease [Candidatus Woesearchaeota archaeon]|nr:ABC transporter permease [Candidatus Woesearchaeota archaeon]